jgi:hypothetical protein
MYVAEPGCHHDPDATRSNSERRSEQNYGPMFFPYYVTGVER